MLVRNLKALPTDLHERESIIILNTETINNALQTYDGNFLFDDKVCYLEKPTKDQAIEYPIIADLYHSGYLKDNIILLANKQEFKDNSKESYLPFDVLTQQTTNYQLNKFIELCQLLGAKYIYISSKELEQNKNDTETKIKAKVPNVVDTEVNTNITFKQKLLTEMMQTYELQGTDPQLIKAKHFMQMGIFDNNTPIQTFYATATNLENRPKMIKVKMKFAQEISNQLKVIAKVNAPILKKAIGEATFNTIQEIAQLIEIEYEVHFP